MTMWAQPRHGRRRWLTALFDRSPAVAGPAAPASAGSSPFADSSAALDAAMAASLQAAVQQTEHSTMAVMERMRQLSDQSAGLLASLHGARADAESKEQQIAGDVALLAQVADFLHALPERVARDMQTLEQIGTEIQSLSGLAEAVQSISMQSHLLSINAAIEASRAGPSGLAFKVVAQEMRALAASSHTAAGQIGGTLVRARAVLRDGMEVNTAAAAREFDEIATVADSVRHLQGRLDGVTACYRNRFDEVAQHGAVLAEGTADVLGQMQFQDVLRQHVERVQAAGEARAALIAQLAATVAPGPAGAALGAELAEVLQRYVDEEARHGKTAERADSGPLIELF